MRVAVIAPSASTPAIFPWIFQRGIQNLKENFQFEPVIYPSCETKDCPITQRAADLVHAFKDPEIDGIICAIGGDDIVRVLPLLDKEVIAQNYKPVFGFSDITGLHLFLRGVWGGKVTYYGGAIMTQYAMAGGMHEYTVRSLRTAWEKSALVEILPSDGFITDYANWADKTDNTAVPLTSNPGYVWHVPETSPEKVRGVLFGGCVETLMKHLMIRKYWPTEMQPTVLILETSEQMPDAGFLYSFIASLGEIGFLEHIVCILVGRPKTVALGQKPAFSDQFVDAQRRMIIRALAHYKDLPAVFGLDIGHTDPQTIVPLGAPAEIDLVNRQIFFDYKA